MFVEDCVQEMTLAAWQHPDKDWIVLRRTAIDFMRHILPGYRQHNQRQTVPLEAIERMGYVDPDIDRRIEAIDAREDLLAFFRELAGMKNGHQKRAILKVIRGEVMTVSERVHLHNWRGYMRRHKRDIKS